MPERVIVLVATHNGMAWVREQLDSIRAQEGVSVSIVASDDASTDGTYELLASMPDVALLPCRGPHGSAGRNVFHALSAASIGDGDYVALADQDDIWHPWKLERAIEQLGRNRCDGYSANVTAFWEDGREELVDKATPQQPWDFLFEAAGPGCTYVLTSRLARSVQAALTDHPNIADRVALHDWFIYAWARANGFRWYIDDVPVLRYRQHEGNVMGMNSGYRAAAKRLAQMRDGWYRAQVEAMAQFCGYDSTPFIAKAIRRTWGGRLTLALHAMRCRRNRRDALALATMALVGWF